MNPANQALIRGARLSAIKLFGVQRKLQKLMRAASAVHGAIQEAIVAGNEAMAQANLVVSLASKLERQRSLADEVAQDRTAEQDLEAALVELEREENEVAGGEGGMRGGEEPR